MNARMLRTELYKIFSKKIVWIAMLVFMLFFLLLKGQFINSDFTENTLEPIRPELESLVSSEELHDYIKNSGYSCTYEELSAHLTQPVIQYAEKNELQYELTSIINNYYERIDRRSKYIQELMNDSTAFMSGVMGRAREKALEAYQTSSVKIELNLDRGSNNLIDVNHSMVFPALIMLVIIVGLSGVYSDEYGNRTQAALLTTRKGRKGVFLSKFIASCIFTVVVVTVMEAFFMVVTIICYHVPSTTISAASTYGLSLTTYEGSVYGFCARQILGTMLAGMVLGCFVMCISALSRSALIPFFISGVVYGGSALYANEVVFPQTLSSIASLPGEMSLFMLQSQVELVSAPHYTSFFGILVPSLVANILLNLVIAVVCLLICYRAYIHKQVKG
ncbi:hypothetical protein BHK98_01970 [Hornefia porci]|uniref:Uncharacterized protein n=1 Tax=Hornefia porci TaxID=2652292 RepID=A0A1Q9JFD5_9FIRM|nr:ABC transporter permease [Hornefia porci]OLR54950.1 hypothetical protein BHK98_01970 [Hornefia porci]